MPSRVFNSFTVYCLMIVWQPARSFFQTFSHPSKQTFVLRRFMTMTDNANNNDDSIYISIPNALAMHGTAVFVDGSWWMKDRSARSEFEQSRIKGAKFLDVNDIATTPHPIPHMMPPSVLFEAVMDEFGITNDSTVIVYGADKCSYIHRAWYQIYAMGHDLRQVKLLDGSLRDWEEAGGPMDKEHTTTIYAKNLNLTKQTRYRANNVPRQVVDKAYIQDVIAGKKESVQIVDARSEERYLAQVDEPRPGLRLGHMPGAKHLFFYSLLDGDNLVKFAARDVLRQKINDAGIDMEQDVVVSCGSGVTACTVAAALIECGKDPSTVSIYDGS
jgi:thiosulfate/3-mercaptopyruvate sulfurtransferase